MNRTAVFLTMAALFSSCSRQPERTEALRSAEDVQRPLILPRARPSIDPKSSDAAELVVRGFVQLINERKLGDAYMLLGPNAPSRAKFDHQWTRYSDVVVASGRAGLQEGAAGSIYVSVPLTISGKLGGRQVRQSARAVLRRVNDVPGSTEAQRRWHIDRIDFSSGS